MPEGNGQPSTGLMALVAGVMVVCCLVPLLLLSLGAAGLAALVLLSAAILQLVGTGRARVPDAR